VASGRKRKEVQRMGEEMKEKRKRKAERTQKKDGGRISGRKREKRREERRALEGEQVKPVDPKSTRLGGGWMVVPRV